MCNKFYIYGFLPNFSTLPMKQPLKKTTIENSFLSIPPFYKFRHNSKNYWADFPDFLHEASATLQSEVGHMSMKNIMVARSYLKSPIRDFEPSMYSYGGVIIANQTHC